MTVQVSSNSKKKKLIFGQDPNVLMALVANIISWFVHTYLPPSYLKLLVPKLSVEQEQKICSNDDSNNNNSNNDNNNNNNDNTECIVIGQPGGMEQLRCVTLQDGVMTCGYNMVSSSQPIPFTYPINVDTDMPHDTVVIKIHALSINYADCCIRWGLYESANTFVGYPIVPGFDFSGIVERTTSTDYQIGDSVYGCTLFGAYSTRVLVPAKQIQKIPKLTMSSSSSSNDEIPLALSMTQAAAIPAVALTSLYALYLAGQYHPLLNVEYTARTETKLFSNNSILIHSAAGGVGGMLVRMSKLLGLSPIVGIVGRSNKVDCAKELGCDVVIDKSLYSTPDSLWDAIAAANSNHNGLYSTIMDSNGIDTLQRSFDSLSVTGRLVVFGFHTNLPMNAHALNPLQWIRMLCKVVQMPKFDPMVMTTANKSVLAFNLSFFDKEINIVVQLFNQISYWIASGQLPCPRIVEMSMTSDVAQAHELIQSGKTVGKLVLTTKYHEQ